MTKNFKIKLRKELNPQRNFICWKCYSKKNHNVEHCAHGNIGDAIKKVIFVRYIDQIDQLMLNFEFKSIINIFKKLIVLEHNEYITTMEEWLNIK